MTRDVPALEIVVQQFIGMDNTDILQISNLSKNSL